MNDYSTLQTKVADLKAKVENNSVTPLYLGSLLDDIIEQIKLTDIGPALSESVAQLKAEVDAELEAMQGRLEAEGQTRAEGDTDLVTRIEALSSELTEALNTDIEARLASEAEARTDADEALRTEIEEVRTRTAIGIELDSETGDVSLVYDEDNRSIEKAEINPLTGDIEITLNI